MRRTLIGPALAAASLCVLTSCTAVWAQSIGDQTVSNLLRLESYRGRTVERGLVPGEPDARVVRELVYAKPWKLRAEVVEPAARAGDLAVYDGESLVLWWPKELLGVRVTGLTPPTEADVREHVVAETAKSLEAYAFSLRGREEVAGAPADRWQVIPVEDDPHRRDHSVWMDTRYSFPLRIEFPGAEAGRPWYAMEFTALEVGDPVADDAFDVTFPANAVVLEWDLSRPGIPLEAARERMNFPVHAPSWLPEGCALDKAVVGEHDLPMLALVFGRGGTWLSLTELRHAGGEYALALGKRVDLGGGRTAYLNFMGSLTTLSWEQGGAQLTLVGNLAFPELIRVARSVAPLEAAPAGRGE